MITSVQIAWIAGLLEGEGCFYFGSSPRIQFATSDHDTAIKIRDIINLEINIRNLPLQPDRKQMYEFAIYGTLAASWMMTIYYLMSNRRKDKIREVLNGWKVSRSLSNDGHCINGHNLKIFSRDYRVHINGAKYCMHCKRINGENLKYKKRMIRLREKQNSASPISV